jgi:hypothetical protein
MYDSLDSNKIIIQFANAQNLSHLETTKEEQPTEWSQNEDFQAATSLEQYDEAVKYNDLDLTAIISTIIPTAAGLGGLIWAVYTYRESLFLKRKDIIFPLIDEFDNSKEMKYAKDILDDRTIKPKKLWQYPRDYYHKAYLKYILRAHNENNENAIFDDGEDTIRRSFDALIDFFCKLEYLLNLKLITRKEISYFTYYIDRVANNEDVMNYISNYEFPLYGHLDFRINYNKLRIN